MQCLSCLLGALFDVEAGAALAPAAWEPGCPVPLLSLQPMPWWPFPAGSVLCSRSTSCNGEFRHPGLWEPACPARASPPPSCRRAGLSSRGGSLRSCTPQAFKLHLEMSARYVFLNLFIFTFRRLIFVEKTFVGHFLFFLWRLNALWPGNDLTSKWSRADMKAKVSATLCLNTCLGSLAAPMVPVGATEETW